MGEHRVTGGAIGEQRVTGGLMGERRVTGGLMGEQRVTGGCYVNRGCKRLQVTFHFAVQAIMFFFGALFGTLARPRLAVEYGALYRRLILKCFLLTEKKNCALVFLFNLY